MLFTLGDSSVTKPVAEVLIFQAIHPIKCQETSILNSFCPDGGYFLQNLTFVFKQLQAIILEGDGRGRRGRISDCVAAIPAVCQQRWMKSSIIFCTIFD